MTNNTSPEKSPWGWKALIIAFILSAFFLGFFYLAVTNEPDYMPSQKRAESNQTAFKNAPVMSQEALAEARERDIFLGELFFSSAFIMDAAKEDGVTFEREKNRSR